MRRNRLGARPRGFEPLTYGFVVRRSIRAELRALRNRKSLITESNKLAKKKNIHSCKKKRRGRDSNPRYPFEVHSLSRRAPSASRSPLHEAMPIYIRAHGFPRTHQAEETGFEPAVHQNAQRISSPPPSTSRPLFRTASWDGISRTRKQCQQLFSR